MNERDLFIATLQIDDPAERAAYLDKACGGDAELRQRVEALLAAFGQAGSFLQQPAAAPSATAEGTPVGPSQQNAPAEELGRVIGPYKLLQQLGEGGMGTVFLAEQTQPVQRKVALKIIKAGMDSRQVIARFEAERQALALMDHPNIAKVHDAGTTETGRPYFVMELVKGVPITRYCDEHRLTPKQRLALFVPVCQAVQHAHQKGIIHRDLKPSNVLVAVYDDKPVPKVIDFGIAKATGRQLTERTLCTDIGQVVGTLEYMSPEQAGLNQLDIDTRSDIYSLGVLLYELLTGTTPLERKRLKAAALLEMLRLIREEEAPRPSMRLSTTDELPSVAANRGQEPKQLSGLVRGELDWIVMKCLEKDRSRRYETANGFAQDIQRYLADEPVQACPPSSGYRLRKFVRRNKGPVVAATVIFLLLIGGIVGTTLGLLQAQRSEEHAQREAIKAGQERDQANTARTAAQTAGAAEKVQRQLVEERGKELRRNLYFAEMNLAGRAAESHVGLARVAELLSHWQTGQPDLRGWEWYYLHGLCHQDLLTISVSSRGVSSVAWSPDGTRLATQSDWTGPKLWDAVTGKEAGVLSRGNNCLGHAVAWSPDGTLLASGDGDWQNQGNITVWEAVSGKRRLTIQGPKKEFVRSIAWAPDGTRLAWGSADKTVTVSDAKTGTAILILKGHAGMVRSVAWNRDGKRLASADQSGRVKIWDSATGKGILDILANQQVMAVSWSPDGRLASVGRSGRIQIWDTDTAKQLLLCHTSGELWSVAWSPDGKRLASGSVKVVIFDAATGKALVTLTGHSDRVASVAWSPDGTRLASASRDGTVKVWAADQKAEPLPLQALNPGIDGDANGIAWSPNGKRLASVDLLGTVKISDVSTGKEFFSLKGHNGAVRSAVAWNPDGTRLASARLASAADTNLPRTSTVKIWDATTGEEVLALKGDISLVSSVAWNRDGTRLAAASEGGVMIWDPVSGERTATLSTAGDLAVSWSPDGTRLATARHTGAVQIWDTAKWEHSCTLEGHVSVANSVAWCPTGKHLASASRDRTVTIWDATTGKAIRTLRGHTEEVFSVSWSPDGTRLASAGGGNIKIWDPNTGNEVITFNLRTARSVAWSPDGLRLATAYPALMLDAANGYRLAGRSAPGDKIKPAHAAGFLKP